MRAGKHTDFRQLRGIVSRTMHDKRCRKGYSGQADLHCSRDHSERHNIDSTFQCPRKAGAMVTGFPGLDIRVSILNRWNSQLLRVCMTRIAAHTRTNPALVSCDKQMFSLVSFRNLQVEQGLVRTSDLWRATSQHPANRSVGRSNIASRMARSILWRSGN